MAKLNKPREGFPSQSELDAANAGWRRLMRAASADKRAQEKEKGL